MSRFEGWHPRIFMSAQAPWKEQQGDRYQWIREKVAGVKELGRSNLSSATPGTPYKCHPSS